MSKSVQFNSEGYFSAWGSKYRLHPVQAFSVALRPHQRPKRLLGTGSPERPPRLSHSSRPLKAETRSVLFTSTETVRTIRDGEPRTATSTFTQLLSSDAERSNSKNYLTNYGAGRIRGLRLTPALSSNTLRPSHLRFGPQLCLSRFLPR